ncbi:MAG TPA: MarR family winged helix-turn-helix transcriptional regulator [Xanthomonadales bacterium]|nr:MarR family winged helix-turn-helix transcriptional regulator [Xanthomonadales bacterium]
MEVLARFRIIFRSARQHYQSVESELGISGAQLRALALIAADEGNGVNALARAMLVRQPTASNLVDQLVRQGLVTKRRSDLDQRAAHLRTTAKARALLRRAPAPASGVLPDALASLDAKTLASLCTALDEVLRAMRQRDDRARFEPISQI